MFVLFVAALGGRSTLIVLLLLCVPFSSSFFLSFTSRLAVLLLARFVRLQFNFDIVFVIVVVFVIVDFKPGSALALILFALIFFTRPITSLTVSTIAISFPVTISFVTLAITLCLLYLPTRFQFELRFLILTSVWRTRSWWPRPCRASIRLRRSDIPVGFVVATFAFLVSFG